MRPPMDSREGILAAVDDPGRAAAIGTSARLLAETKYSYDAYLNKTRLACAGLESASRPPLNPVKDLA